MKTGKVIRPKCKYCARHSHLQTFQGTPQTRKGGFHVTTCSLICISEIRLRNGRLETTVNRWKSLRKRFLTHSLPKTPSRHSGPINDSVSIVGAVASVGLNSGMQVIMLATLLIVTNNSSPLTTPRHPASPPASPSGRVRHSWDKSSFTTGPSTGSNSSSWNLRASSWTNCSIFEASSVSGPTIGPERSGAERVESERSGATSSGGPTGRLKFRSMD